MNMTLLDRESFQSLALSRLEDAEVLVANQRFAAAFYLVGYVVECGLKACIARKTREHEFPNRSRVIKSYSHDLTQLREVAQVPFKEEFASDRRLEENWSLVGNNWSEQKRYEMAAKTEAEDLLRAVNDPDHGVLQWLQKYW